MTDSSSDSVAPPAPDAASEQSGEPETGGTPAEAPDATPGLASRLSASSLVPAPAHDHRKDPLMMLALTALGVVFGDIGTSPLYAFRESLHGPHAVTANHDNVFGVLSLIFWSLTIVIALKYLAYVLRADNRGEGGILALMALASKATTGAGVRHRVVFVLGLFGAALLYGDGMITPAITVLSAVEGLEIAAPGFRPYVIPIAIGILVALFMIQSRGTGKVGIMFGPITLLWFVALAVLGVSQIVQSPEVLAALNPYWAAKFLLNGGLSGFLVLGAVFLVVTGGEALYADIGHFGTRPIRVTWFWVVMPALVLNYFGQGAHLLDYPEAIKHPFFHMVPSWGLYPMIALATLASTIASQALITGAFSVTRQAMMLGFWPRFRIEHTSPRKIGQIYVPLINWLLMLSAIGLVLGFGSSSKLAHAYGIAVNMDMVITTLLAFVVARTVWNWPLHWCVAITIGLLAVDLAFFGANASKIPTGGWFPLVIGGALFALMTTWKRGRAILAERFREQMVPLSDFFELFHVERPARVPGFAVYMTSNSMGAPPALMTNFMHNRAVHQNVILLTVITEEVARVEYDERVEIEHLEAGFYRIVAHYGFMETPDIPTLLGMGLVPDYALEHTTFFLGRETVLATRGGPGMALWRERLFAFMSRNAQPATAFFGIPADRVVEIGTQVEI